MEKTNQKLVLHSTCMNFFQGLPLAELQTGMKLLYSVNTNGYQEASKQIQFLVEQSHVVMNQTESQYFRMKLAGFRMLRQIPMMLAGGKAQSGKTTVDIAKKFGVTDRTICRWFDKPESMNLLDFYQFCDELGLKISIAFKDVPE